MANANSKTATSPDIIYAAADYSTTTALTGVWIGLSNNDSDTDGYVLAVTAVGLTGTKGTVTLNPAATNGAYYSPGTAFAYLSAGETATDTFTYVVSDGHGGTATQTATVTITGVNQAPIAHADTATTTAPQSVQLTPLANDTDVNRDDTLSVSALNTSATKGTVALGSNNVVTYTPGAAFRYLAAGTTATDTFGYTVTDNHGGTSTATDTVTITGTWLAPVAHGDTASTNANQSVTINVLANDTDAEPGQTLSVSALNLKGTNGTVVVNANGTITYTPGAAFTGLAPDSATTDSFGYTVSDGHGGTSTATVKVTVDAPGASATAPTALYVATDGNNAWAGDLAAPNAAGTDGPLATLQAAQAKMEASPTTKTTYVEGGTYHLGSSLALTSADSGESWLGYPGQTATIDGGQQITGWTMNANGVWTAQAPAGAFTGSGATNNLYIDGQAATASRYPDAVPNDPVDGGWLFAAANLPGSNTSNTIHFNPGDVPADLAGQTGLYVDVYSGNGWSNSILPISSINYQNDTITLNGSVAYGVGQDSRYYIFNTQDQLSAGEWSYDPADNTVSYKPVSGVTTAPNAVVGSVDNLVTLNGANNVTVSGLTLADGAWGGTSYTGSAVNVYASSNDVISNNTLDNVDNGVMVTTNSNNVTVQGNTIENTDYDGVWISTGSNNATVNNNNIHDIGQLFNGNGIWFTGSSNDIFSNNQIQNTAKFAIGGGSVSGASDASYNDAIEFNTTANSNLDTSDGGAIMLSGTQQSDSGDQIVGNTISGVTAAGNIGYNGVPGTSFLPTSSLVSYGIYLDLWASGVTISGNLVTDSVAGVLIHGGSDNTITNNDLFDNSGSGLVNEDTALPNVAARTPVNNVFSGNVVVSTQAAIQLAENIGAANAAQFHNNTYEGTFGSTSFATDSGTFQWDSATQWQARGYDAGSAFTSPQSVAKTYQTSGDGSTVTVSPPVADDFNGDGKSDLLLQNTNGSIVIETQSNLAITAGASLGDPGPTWHVVGSADFNGDGQPDILLQNDNGTVIDYLMNGTTVAGGYDLTNPGSSWHVRGTGDFNGDGQSDIVLQNDNGSIVVDYTNGVSVTGGATISDPGPGWTVEGVADFNGDGQPDILLQNTNGAIVDYLMNGATVAAGYLVANPGAGWSVAGTGNYNADSDADIVLHNDNGTDVTLNTNGTSVIGSSAPTGDPGATWTGTVAGSDYNGDGVSDLLLQNTNSTLAGFTLNGNAAITASAVLGTPGAGWNAVGNDPVQYIDGTGSNLNLTATAGADQFNLTSFTAGLHTITGFDPAQDMVALSAASYPNFAAVQAAEAPYQGGTYIGLPGNSGVIIQGVTPSQLTASNFALR